MRSEATTVKEYLAEVSAERRDHLAAVRSAIQQHAPEAEECREYGHPHDVLRGPPVLLGSTVRSGSIEGSLPCYVAKDTAVLRYVESTGRKHVGTCDIRFTPTRPIPSEQLADVVRQSPALRLDGEGSEMGHQEHTLVLGHQR